MSCVTGPSKKRCHAAAAQWGSRANEHDSEGALIVSLLTQCLVQFCHLWMVPARRLGLMAVKRTEKKNKRTEEFAELAKSGGERRSRRKWRTNEQRQAGERREIRG